MIEQQIVNKYVESVLEGTTRRCIYLLVDHLNSGSIKAYANDNVADSGSGFGSGSGSSATHTDNAIMSHKSNTLMIKISGVWETKDECGLSYKFIKC
jgi:hypothetical protein